MADRIDFFSKFGINLKVVFEDNDFLIIEKPAGLLVHSTKYSQEKTLVDLILFAYPEIKVVGQSGREGIVHRLDRNVSGLMVIARSLKMYDSLINQFQQSRVKKEYIAFVYNFLSLDRGRIENFLARNKKGKIIALSEGYRDKIKMKRSAVTEYEIIKKYFKPRKMSLLKLRPLTGRTHQLRIHLKTIGCPIVGDKEYGIKNSEIEQFIEPNRIMLHAGYLGFYNLENIWKEFRIDLPEEFKIILKEFEENE